ncbi:hypothetical protein [Fodinibius salsisoli]|uniref:Outer membrane protein beta-barrel domain-containing protein n=1 Tax=Fodinibius salsisoli TaxID=2820877 RepID=A0ABT3PJJ7_9BACT|nr:hypothetical protein [Fodinibius salsisoli]MCW9706116.1 hypothetical protein [Fodinibius salsisoli]
MDRNFLSQILFLCLIFAVISISSNAQSKYKLNIGLDILPDDDTVSERLKVTNNYQFSPQLSAGLGTGFTYYDDPLSLIPIFIDLRYKLLQNDLAPFVFLDTGYTISVLTDTDTRTDSHRGGWMLNPGLGVQFSPKNGPGWYLSIGYSTDHSQFEREEGSSRTIKNEVTYKRLMAGFGLFFRL